YPTNKLIGREPIPDRKNFPPAAMRGGVVAGVRRRFHRLARSQGQVAHVLLTRSPLVYPRRGLTARLAGVKHAASVRPEPGSNSPSRSNTPPRAEPGGETWKRNPARIRVAEKTTRPSIKGTLRTRLPRGGCVRRGQNKHGT